MSAEETEVKPAIREIFLKALELSPADREAYLARACGKDPQLRSRIDALLKSTEDDSFLERPAAQVSSTVVIAPGISEGPGTVIDKYKLLEKLGEGGFGVVYMAEQKQPVKRRVALKIIKVGMDTREVVARFEAERQALAVMDHANIAKVFDAGATETGRPYFVMELVRGVKVTDYCDEKNLSTQERLNLFMQVCQAVQHAHQKGIIHRDLKPSNILVTVNDGIAIPKIIDFGIAKATQMELTEKTVFTRFQQFIGTPAYMSPEQAEITSVDIDTRSDIYSLGVLLYELLTGKTPFDAKELLQAGLDEMRRTLREKEPDRPSTRVSTLGGDELTTTAKRRGLEAPKLVNLLRGDLDWIVMKCLEKDRARRYETANGLAMDIQRHLSNEPVVACPPSTVYRFRKMVRRHRVAVAATAAVACALLLGLVVSAVLLLRERRERQRAETAERGQLHLRHQAETEAANNRQVAQFVKDLLKGLGPSVTLVRDTTMLRQILDKAVERVESQLTNQHAVLIELRATIATTYGDLGYYDRMEELARKDLELARSSFGEESKAVADALDQLGEAQLFRGNLVEAEKTIREALGLQRKLFGTEHPDIARSLRRLGNILHNRGRPAEAEASIREALAMQEKLLGEEHMDVANTLDSLAVELRATGQLAEVEALERRALQTKRKLVGNEHPSLSESLDVLGMVLKEQGKLQEAEATYRQLVAMNEKLLGNDHPWVGGALGGLGSVLLEEGQLPEAERLLRDGMRIEKGADPWTMQFLALAHEKQGKWAEAEINYRETVALRKKMSVWPRSFVLDHLTSVLRQQGKDSEAVAARNEWMEACRKAAEAGDVFAQNDIAWYLSTSREPAVRDATKAIALAEKAVQGTRRKNPEFLDTLAAALAESGQFQRAIDVQKEAITLSNNEDLKKDFISRLSLYQSGAPYHEP